MPIPQMAIPKTRDDVTLFQGGLDITTPNLRIKPGHVRAAQNWQAVANEEGGGYERIAGYERFTGQASPSSSVVYTVLAISSWILKPSQWTSSDTDIIGVHLVGATSGAQALLSVSPGGTPWPMIGGGTFRQLRSFAVEDATDPLWEGFPYCIVNTLVSGEFQSGETLTARYFDGAGNESAPWDVAVIASYGDMFYPLSARANAIIRATIEDQLRALLSFVPGSGPILGVVSLVKSGVRTVYAWRNTADGSAAAIYKSSSVGWTAVPLYHEVRFTAGGTSQPVDGSPLTQGATTATIKRVVLESGSWASGTASGRFIIINPGVLFTAGAASIVSISVTLSGPNSLITLLPGGTYQFDVANFGGQLTSKRIYGADGVNRAFEFDGEILVPIETKAAQDTPKYIRKQANHLVLAIGGSLMISGPGTPYIFSASLGAMEIATGDDITGLQVQVGDQQTAALAVFGRNSSGILYGTSSANFTFKSLATMTGSIPYMQANLDQTYILDDRGVMSLAAAQEYGNFRQATLTANIAKFLTDRKSRAIGCCVSTDRSQFRLFFSDGSALYMTIVNGRLIGPMPQQFNAPFSCVWSAEDAGGNEETFAGAENGFVYKLDTSRSFDGAPISHFLVFSPNFMGSPSVKKKFYNGHLEVDAETYAEFSIGYSLRYGSAGIFQPDVTDMDNATRSVPAWGVFVWDNFIWDGVTIGPMEVDIKGKAEAIQMIVSGSSDYVQAFRLNSLTIHYEYTRKAR